MYNIYIYNNFNEDATHKKIFLAKEKDGALVAPTLHELNPAFVQTVSNVFNGQRNSVDITTEEPRIYEITTNAQKIAIEDFRVRWYDVTGFDLIAKSTIRFYITPDDFHTYFCTAEPIIQPPKINTITGNLVQSNATKYKDNALYPSSSAIGNKINYIFPLMSYLKRDFYKSDGSIESDLDGYRVVVVVNYTDSSNENWTRTLIQRSILPTDLSRYAFFDSIHKISSATDIYTSLAQGDYEKNEMKCLAIYAIPTVFLPTQREIEDSFSSTAFFKGRFKIANFEFTTATDCFRDVDFTKIPHYDDNAMTYQIGTFGNRVTIPFNHKNLIAKVMFSAAEECSVVLQVGNQLADITNEFEFAVIENDYARYLSENKNGRMWKYIGAGVSLIKSITSGNIGAIAGEVISIGSTLAAEKDRAAQAYNVNLPTPAALNLFPLTYKDFSESQSGITRIDNVINGLAIFVVEPQDYNERKVNFETYGGNCQLLPVTFTNATGSDTAVGFFKCDNVHVDTYMHAPDSAKENIKNLFRNGVFLFE